MKKSPWQWVPTLYFMEGLPFTIIMMLSTVMYKNFGISNAKITFYTGFLYLPWMIKPAWSWFIDAYKTKRMWIYSTELAVAALFVCVAGSLLLHNFFFYSLLLFGICAFISASHDISADGFYLMTLNIKEQSFFVGMQSLFYQCAKIFASGLLVYISGYLIIVSHGNMRATWGITILLAAIVAVSIGIYHKIKLPRYEVALDKSCAQGLREVKSIFTQFFKLKGVWITILFVMTFRIGENQIIKIAPLFILDSRAHGGLGFDNTYLGFANMFIMGAMVAAGVLGGITISRFGLKKCIWYMLVFVNLPHVIYIYLAYTQPSSQVFVLVLQIIENFVTTFSLTAYTMMAFMLVRDSQHKTAHYAFISAFMMAGIMLPSMFSGIIEQAIGYKHFFIFVLLTMIPCILVVPFIKIPSTLASESD